MSMSSPRLAAPRTPEPPPQPPPPSRGMSGNVVMRAASSTAGGTSAAVRARQGGFMCPRPKVSAASRTEPEPQP